MNDNQNTPLGDHLTKSQTPASPGVKPRRWRVLANVTVPLAAQVEVEAICPWQADGVVTRVLQGRPFTENLHKLLQRNVLIVPESQEQQLKVCLESVLLDWPPEAIVWDIIEV
jgi:hypothetical protein